VDEIWLTINGQAVRAEKGMTVLEAARAAEIYIPTLCYDPDLEPYGGCRLCVVEIEGVRGLPTACTMPASDGMVVHTETEAVNNVRRIALELLLANHPSDCLVCDRRTGKERCNPYDVCLRNVAVTDRCVTCPANGQCELQKVVDYMGITELRLPRATRSFPIDTSNPFFDLDRNRCILCARCVRTCNEITGVGAIDMAYRGYSMKVTTFGDKELLESICRSCGECVVHCPVGALSPKETHRPTREVKTTCPYCGVGCQVYMGIKDEQIISVRGDRDNDVNRSRLCVKGRFGIAEFVHHPERLTTPLIRRNGSLTEATWDEALDLIADKLGSYQSNELAVISSAKCTNEDNYVAQKFARAVLGTNNVDHCARLCHAPTVAGLVQSFGSGAMTNSIGEIGDAKCILAIGTNTTAAHPVIGFEIKRAVRKGGKLIVANPREIDLVRSADLWLQHRPGSDVALLMGMMRVIVEEGLLDSDFIKERCENFDAFKESLKNFGLDFVEKTTGVPGDMVVAAARLYATNRPSTLLYAMGITQSSHGTDNVIATANLAMLTGNVGKPSTGVNPLRGQNNVQGACDLGALPNVYSGYQAVSDPAIKDKFEAAWGCSLSDKPGLTLTEMIPAAYDRKIKAIYLTGENPALADADIGHVREALEKLDFLVVQDIFLSETAQLAHVVLPGATFAEKDGSFTNTERKVQRVRKAVEPVGDSKPDWWITCQIAQRMGSKGFDFADPSQIMDEVNRLTPSYGGITYRRLEEGGLQWPCPTEEHPGTLFLHATRFTRGKGRLIPLEYKPPMELPDDEYPLILTTERSLFHFHTGTMTRKVKGLNVLLGKGLVEINPQDASDLSIADGEVVKVISRRGEIAAQAKVTGVSPRGVVSMNFHFAESPANMLTNPALDPVSKIPEYKVCAVRIEKNGGSAAVRS
jgi:formate dehydrogenase alpha subunit